MKNAKTFLVLFVSIALLVWVWGLKDHEVLTKPVAEVYEVLRIRSAAKIEELKERVKGNTVLVDLSSLAGYRLGGLYAVYLGILPGPVPGKVKVSFDERMANMYHQKVMFEKCGQKDLSSCTTSSETVLNHAPGLLEAYLSSDKMKMNLSQFIGIAEDRVRLAKLSMDWPALCRSAAYRLNKERCELLQSIVGELNGRDLIAYGMTELLSSSDGRLNVRYMDVLLRYAGAQFLYYVPALGDGYASLGLYQFTFYAIRKDAQRVEGVNVVNAFIKKGGEQVPGSVIYLRGHQHHTAAFYFAVHNLASLISGLKDSEFKTLKSVYHKMQAEMVVIVACAHHAPGYTRSAVIAWLKVLDQATHPPKKKKGQKVKPVNTDLIPLLTLKADLRAYGMKTMGNLEAVYRVK